MPDKPAPPPPELDEPGKHKDVPITSRVSEETAAKARERAAKEKRTLSEILRSWLTLFANDEAPSPPKVDVVRAKQRPRKPKPAKPAPPTTPPKPKKQTPGK